MPYKYGRTFRFLQLWRYGYGDHNTVTLQAVNTATADSPNGDDLHHSLIYLDSTFVSSQDSVGYASFQPPLFPSREPICGDWTARGNRANSSMGPSKNIHRANTPKTMWPSEDQILKMLVTFNMNHSLGFIRVYIWQFHLQMIGDSTEKPSYKGWYSWQQQQQWRARHKNLSPTGTMAVNLQHAFVYHCATRTCYGAQNHTRFFN